MSHRILIQTVCLYLLISLSPLSNFAQSQNHIAEAVLQTYFQLNTPYSRTVYICTGPYAYAYHSQSDCGGLANCKDNTKSTNEHYALFSLKRTPCKRCLPHYSKTPLIWWEAWLVERYFLQRNELSLHFYE